MKILKQSILAGALLFAGLATAQQRKGMKNMLKVGGHVGIVLPSENTSMALGVDVAYQYLVTPSFGLGVATGYTHFFGQENEGYDFKQKKQSYDNNNVGVLPVAALLRYYPKKTGFYFGTDIGYGFLLGDNQITSNINAERPNGGLYLKPEIGYHNNDWNFSIHYQKIFTDDKYNFPNQDYNLGSLGIGVGYNIPLGN